MQDTNWRIDSEMESSVNHHLNFEGSVWDCANMYDNVASTNTLRLTAIPEPTTIIDDQDAVDNLDLTPSIVQRLACLDVAIYKCGLNMPFPIEAGSESAPTGSRKSTMFALDELFRLTTEFLEIWNSLSHGATQHNLSFSSAILPGSSTGSTLPLLAYNQRLSETVQPANLEESARPFPVPDEATMFMIISCHCRLTEFYGFLFERMHACIDHSHAPRRDKHWAIILPQLQVGSLASPPVHVDVYNPVSSTTSSMYMLMITMISSRLWGQLAHEMKFSNGIPQKTGLTSVLTETVWHNVTDQNTRILQTIENTKSLLQRRSVTV
jgi:hypothetical protein